MINIEYISGLFDADGHVGVGFNNRITGYPKRFIELTSINVSILNDIKDFLGYGQIYIDKRHGRRKISPNKEVSYFSNCQKSHRLLFTNCENIKRFCNTILSCSIIKNNQLNLMIKACNIDLRKNKNNKEQYIKLANLNQKQHNCNEIIKIPKMINWGWLAGLIDGDGVISIYKNKRGYMQPYIGVIINNIKLAKWLSYKINGRVISSIRLKDTKPLTEVKISTKDGINKLLDNILPYLIIKKKKAEILKKIININPVKLRVDRKGFKYLQPQLKLLDNLYCQFKSIASSPP